MGLENSHFPVRVQLSNSQDNKSRRRCKRRNQTTTTKQQKMEKKRKKKKKKKKKKSNEIAIQLTYFVSFRFVELSPIKILARAVD